MDENLLTTAQAAEAIKQRPATMTKWRSEGKGPPYLKLGRACYYRPEALRQWLAAQERAPRSAHDRRAA